MTVSSIKFKLMNIQKLGTLGGNQKKPGQERENERPRRFRHNAESVNIVEENKKISDFLDITEAEFIDLVSERDLLATEIIFTRTGNQYSSHCHEQLQQYEKLARSLEHNLKERFETSLKANSVIQDSIFAEIEVSLSLI